MNVEPNVLNESAEENATGVKPAFRVIQTDSGPDGVKKFSTVGAVWRNTSKEGKEFYVLKVGQLRLLMFANENK